MSPGEPAATVIPIRGARTRAALIAAGRRLFAERAVDAVAIDDIVGAADVGKGSFYNHFADKDALIRAISANVRKGIEQAVSAANTGAQDSAIRVARAVCTYMRYALDEPELSGFLIRTHSGHTSIDAPLNQGLVQDISSGLAAGRFQLTTVETGVLLVLGVAQIALVRLAQDPQRAVAIALAQQMCALLLRGLGVGAEECNLIAAQAADDVIRIGLHADTARGLRVD